MMFFILGCHCRVWVTRANVATEMSRLFVWNAITQAQFVKRLYYCSAGKGGRTWHAAGSEWGVIMLRNRVVGGRRPAWSLVAALVVTQRYRRSIR